MVRKVELTVDISEKDNLKQLLLKTHNVHGMASFTGDEHCLFTFRCKEKHSGDIVSLLKAQGYGMNKGRIDITSLTHSAPRLPASEGKKKYSYNDRMTIEEIFDFIDEGIHLTFEYMMFCLVGAVIACAGLITNSSVIVVAAMLVSPIMGPINGLTFGFRIGDHVMMFKGFRTEWVGILIIIVTGLISGLLSIPFMHTFVDPEEGLPFEMTSRGDPNNLIAGFAIAAASGVGVALSLTNGGASALVGVAISASLLPPIANAGLLFCFYFAYQLGAPVATTETNNMNEKLLEQALVSFSLFLMNWVLLFCFATLTFKLKGINRNSVTGAVQAWATGTDAASPDQYALASRDTAGSSKTSAPSLLDEDGKVSDYAF